MAGFVNYQPRAQLVPAQPSGLGQGLQPATPLGPPQQDNSASQNAIIASLGNLLPAGFGGTPMTQGPGPATGGTSPVASPGPVVAGVGHGDIWPGATPHPPSSGFGGVHPAGGFHWSPGMFAPGGPRFTGSGPHTVTPGPPPSFASWFASHLASQQGGAGVPQLPAGNPLAALLAGLFGARPATV